MSLEKRIFFCFVIIVVFFCSGCSTVKHEWFPKNQVLQKPILDKENGGDAIEVNVIGFKL
jgi:hypothetical protein